MRPGPPDLSLTAARVAGHGTRRSASEYTRAPPDTARTSTSRGDACRAAIHLAPTPRRTLPWQPHPASPNAAAPARHSATPTGTRRVALYLRHPPTTNQPFSIDAQQAALASYVNSQPGWILAAEPFTDDASGAITERPGLQRALHPPLRIPHRPRNTETRSPMKTKHRSSAKSCASTPTKYLGTRAIAAELNRRGITNRTGKKWSGLTIGRILDNPAYTGDIVYGDTHVPNAHPALIDRDTRRRVRDIADARADTHHQRAMSDSDYHLTGRSPVPGARTSTSARQPTAAPAATTTTPATPAPDTAPTAAPAPASTPPPSTKPSCKPPPRLLPQRRRPHRRRHHPRPSPPPRQEHRSTRRTRRRLERHHRQDRSPRQIPHRVSRTAPWTRKTPDPASGNCAPRSKPQSPTRRDQLTHQRRTDRTLTQHPRPHPRAPGQRHRGRHLRRA